jgi:hypothetical protein
MMVRLLTGHHLSHLAQITLYINAAQQPGLDYRRCKQLLRAYNQPH